MTVDLTCSTCEGTGELTNCALCGITHPCPRQDCRGTGRRRPTLAEWDALVAERDELLRQRDAAHDARIEAQNPGIDMDEVRRQREEIIATARAGPEPRRRLRECVERWPSAHEGGFDPRCCRFPKSCSADVYDDDAVSEGDLEPRRARAALDRETP